MAMKWWTVDGDDAMTARSGRRAGESAWASEAAALSRRPGKGVT